VEFCYAIPTNLKIRDGWDRFILRSSMDNLLPPEIQWRPKKTDIGINFVRNIIKFDMKDIDDLFQNLGIIEKYIDLKNLNFSYDKLLNEKCDLELFKLWKVITLIIWSHTLDKIVCCSE
ncbi:MAG: asparagine synthase-related protein, partial [Methanobacterium sp.]